MIYSDTDILSAIISKTIKISPYSDLQLQTNSYDLCLGNTFYECFWDNEGPFYVGPYVYLDGDKVEIPVAGTLLGVTIEHVETSGKVIAELRSKSSTRRMGITTNCDAGLGDIGYSDMWTMEFTAFVGLHHRCIDCLPFLIVGDTVAQMVFFECKSKPTKKYDGQYQVEWPLNMIPIRYRHRVIVPKLS